MYIGQSCILSNWSYLSCPKLWDVVQCSTVRPSQITCTDTERGQVSRPLVNDVCWHQDRKLADQLEKFNLKWLQFEGMLSLSTSYFGKNALPRTIQHMEWCQLSCHGLRVRDGGDDSSVYVVRDRKAVICSQKLCWVCWTVVNSTKLC